MAAADPVFLTYDDQPAAEPCFRTMAWFTGTLNDVGHRTLAAALVDSFWRSFGSDGCFVTLAGRAKSPRARPATPAVLTEMAKWISDTDKPSNAWMHIEGPDDSDSTGERVPFLQLHHGMGMVKAEVCVPHQSPGIVAFADAMADVVMAPTLLCALQGMGYLLPPSKESLASILPATTLRYRAAIEMQLMHPTDGLQVRGSGFFWEDHPDLQPGLPDIGWRTILGPALAARAGDVPATPGVVQMRRADCLALTAGPAPIWGDVTLNEDLGPYQAVARLLAPLAMPRSIMESGYFTADPDDADHLRRLDLYLGRFA